MSAPHDFRLYHGNDLAVLAGVLAAELARSPPGDALLTPDTILIPQVAMKRWLQQALAQTHGIAANLRFLTPGEFVHEALQANLAPPDDAPLARPDVLRWRLWELLAEPDLTGEAVFAPLRALLDRDARERQAWSLAGELAQAFERYQAWRRDWLLAWDRGADTQDWQAALWRRVMRGGDHRAARLARYLQRFGPEGDAAPRGLPPRLFVFACQHVSPDVLRVIASAARAGPLHFFFVSPVAGWWGDLRTAAERLREDADAFAADDETPLLRANGAAGRDFVRLLFDYESVHPSIDLPIYVAPDPALRRGLLHRLQRDLLERRPLPPAAERAALPRFDAEARADPSLQVHACATPLREIQVLHDRLRGLLEADRTLHPRDIAVLAPDIAAYAGAVHAVFGAQRPGTSAIPYAIADLGAGAGSTLPALFLQLLELPRSRFEASAVLDALALPAVAQRHALDPGDLAQLRLWIEAAGARWGLDAAHRAALGEPAEPAFTWAWALDRLLLGHALGCEDEIEGVAPLARIEGQALQALDALLQWLRALARLQRALAQPHPASRWQGLLARALDDLLPAYPAGSADARALAHLRGLCERLAREVGDAGIERAIPVQVVRDWFVAALAEPDARQPFLTGGVTFARMVPMRLIPFRVICVLGLDDGVFPRRDPAGGINRIDGALGSARRRRGDRSLREDDRGLFLQLFAAATDVFHVSYAGIDPRSGETLPPSVVVSELLDVAAAAFSDAAEARAALVIRHPLQPYAPAAFGSGDARRSSFAAEWRIESMPMPGPEPRFARRLTSRTPTQEMELGALQRVLAHPPAAYLRDGLGLWLDEGAARLPDAEPFAQDDALRLHRLEGLLFEALLAAPDASPEVLAQQMLARGAVAPGAVGVREVARLRATLRPAQAQWQRWAAGAAQRRSVTVQLDDVTLSAVLAPVHDVGLLQFRAGRAHGRARLALGLARLMWSAAGETRPVHRLVLQHGADVRPALPAAQARAALQDLVDLARQAQIEALPLLPDCAWIYAEGIARGDDPAQALARARAAWQEQAARDHALRLALRGDDPFAAAGADGAERFRQLALRLCAALHELDRADDERAA